MKLLRGLPVLNQHRLLAWVTGRQAGRKEEARPAKKLRQKPNIPPLDAPEEPLEAELTRRIEWLEATITGLEHDQRKLRESEKLYRSLVEHSISDIITVLEADGTVRTHESPAIERVLGRNPSERLGTSAFNWIHPDDIELALNIFADILDKPGVHPPIEFRVPRLLNQPTQPSPVYGASRARLGSCPPA